MKYRRKDEIVDATYNATGFATTDMVFEGPCYHYERPDGQEVVYSAERFEREYERVGEETKIAVCPYDIGRKCENIHCEICTYCMTRESANCETSDGVTRFFCHGCWAKRRAEKSKPLTIADLKPGDVFEFDFFDGVRTCQHMGARTSASEYWRGFFTNVSGGKPYLYDWKWSKESQDMSGLRRLGHHNLTEKQRLWVDADQEMRGALEKSISEKWLPIMRGEKKGQGVSDCALCKATRSCDKCLCTWGDSEGCTSSGGYRDYYEKVTGPIAYDGARHFTLWLASFLPNIHPLRIEVEVTPVEWPGKARDK